MSKENQTGRFYVLEFRKAPRHYVQLGIVRANSIEEAATKIGGVVLEIVKPPESCVDYCEMKHGYVLTETAEIHSLLEHNPSTD